MCSDFNAWRSRERLAPHLSRTLRSDLDPVNPIRVVPLSRHKTAVFLFWARRLCINQKCQCFERHAGRGLHASLPGEALRKVNLHLIMVEYRPQLEHLSNPFLESSNCHNFVGKGRPCQSSNHNISTLEQRSALSIKAIMRLESWTSIMSPSSDIPHLGPGSSPSRSAPRCGDSLPGSYPGIFELHYTGSSRRRISSRYSWPLRFQENSAALFRPCKDIVARRS